MLVSGELRPGSPLRQEVLAQRLGVSRVPIREALRMLEAEGLVRHEQNSGYTVARLTPNEVAQAYTMRRALETELVLAIGKVSSRDIRRLRKLSKQIDAANDADDSTQALILNKEFHFAIFELAGLDVIVEHLHRVWALSDPYRSLVIYSPETPQRISEEHAQMIDHLEAGDLEQLRTLMDRHRDAGARRVLQMLAHLERLAPQMMTRTS